MTSDSGAQGEWFEGITDIVIDPLRFKEMLAIGEDAYKTLRLKRIVGEAWDVVGVGMSAAQVVSLPVIAGHFFSAGGILGVLGIGTAVTPLGWVLASAVVASGAWMGVTRYLKSASGSRVTVIPKFINTPLDVLALSLFDLMAPLALKVARIDGHIDKDEIKCVEDYFVSKWGYSKEFVAAGIAYCTTNLDEFSIKEIATALAEFKKDNPDCNYGAMAAEILAFLRTIAEADGHLDEREEMAIERVEAIFDDVSRFKLGATLMSVASKTAKVTTRAASTVAEGAAEGAIIATIAAGEAVEELSRAASKGLRSLGRMLPGRKTSK